MLQKARRNAVIKKWYRIRHDGKLEFSDTRNDEAGFTGETEKILHWIEKGRWNSKENKIALQGAYKDPYKSYEQEELSAEREDARYGAEWDE